MYTLYQSRGYLLDPYIPLLKGSLKNRAPKKTSGLNGPSILSGFPYGANGANHQGMTAIHWASMKGEDQAGLF